MTDFMRRLLLPYPYLAPEDEGAGGGETDKVDEGDAAEGEGADVDEGKAVEAEAEGGDGAEEGAEGADKGKDADEGDKASEVAASFPENWRELAADGDDELLKELKRYGSVKNVVKALKESKDTIRSGKLKRDMPDPKDEKAMAEWRKSEGIPDDPTGYELPDTVKTRMTDEDKPIIASFTEYAHQKGATPAAVNLAAEWYFDTLEAMEGERIAKDNEARETAEETLRKDWGGEYKANLQLGAQFVSGIPGVGKDWTDARMPDGRRLGDIPEFVSWAADMGRGEFGDPVFATSDSIERHNSRKAEIEGIMKADINRYYKEGLDREYSEILQREERKRA